MGGFLLEFTMNLSEIDISKYLTINDISYITGLAKPTIRAMYNNKSHSYRDDFPKPIKAKIGKARLIFNKDDIFKFIKNNPPLFNKASNFEVSFSTPTIDKNFFSVEIYHKPTDTYISSRISGYEFNLANACKSNDIEYQSLLFRLVQKAITNLSKDNKYSKV